MNEELAKFQFKHSPYIPYDPSINPLYMSYGSHPAVGGVMPFTYTGWRDEMMSWHESCYIHAGLNPFLEAKVEGPDAVAFLKKNLTNDIDNIDVGRIKHALMVNEDGLLMVDGLLIRTGETSFELTCCTPYLLYRASIQDYNVTVKDVCGDTFFYQLGGPRSLEIIEAATKEDFHDLKFLHFRTSQINGMEVRVLRIGMAGSLAYEVHGNFPDAIPVYEALCEAGKEYNLKKLGRHAYWNTHTENGFPQAIIHFPYANECDSGYWKWLNENHRPELMVALSYSVLKGSVENSHERYVNPYELGWGGSVNFNHDFIGKDALMKIKEKNERKIVTLVWNTEDILDVIRSGFESGEPYAPIEGPEDMNELGQFEYVADKVLIDGKYVGTSTGRIHSWFYRKMLSLGLINTEECEIGKEVVILWGTAGGRQKEIRATIERYPYMNKDRNETLDVSKIPNRLK